MASNTGFRFDGVINIPTVIALIAIAVTGATAVASAQTTANDAQRRVGVIENNYKDVPSRIAAIEAYQKAQTDYMQRIVTNLPR